jgi:exodeoxyribonuclease V alpha subunit
MASVRGELLSFRVAGSDGWGFGAVRTLHDGGNLSIVGKLVGAHAGETVELDGDYVTHPRYGKQLKVKSCRVVLPQNHTGVVGWLSAKLPQISKRRAEALVERFGVDELWKILDSGDPSPLCEIDGITPMRATEILDAYVGHKADRDRIVRFKQWGLTDNQIAKVIDAWQDKAEERIVENPYKLIEFVKGFGWERADAVALRMGVRRDDVARLCAALSHAMELATQAGHCFIASGKLVALVSNKIAAIQDESAVREALDLMVRTHKLARIEQNIYLPRIAQAEAQLAKTFAKRAQQAKSACA